MTKWIALIFMFMDHYAFTVQSSISADTYTLLRMFGRLSFPLFVYFSVLGVQRTSNIKKYISTMFIFAIISELVIRSFPEFASSQNNVLFGFGLYGLFYMYILDEDSKLSSAYKGLLGVLLFYLIYLTNYSYMGFIMFVGLYYVSKLDKHKSLYASLVIGVSFIPFVLSGIGLSTQMFAMFSGLLMFIPSLDKRLLSPKIEKWVFYFAYPLQWLVLSLFL